MFGHSDHNDNSKHTDDTAALMPALDSTTDNTLGSGVVTPSADASTASTLESTVVGATPDLPETPSPEQSSAPTTGNNDDLISLKQQALQHLSPLVSHLDQTPEEKFRTTMMMIQASDDKTLIKSALEAAKAITDDKARAQALLDVINEINYFTQQTS